MAAVKKKPLYEWNIYRKFQLINEEWIIELENHHFTPPESNHRTKTMSLDSFKTCTGKLGREFDDRKLRLRQLNSMINLVLTVSLQDSKFMDLLLWFREGHTTTQEIFWPKACPLKKKMHNLKVENYVYSVGSFKERASQIKLFGKGNDESSIYARIYRNFCDNNT